MMRSILMILSLGISLLFSLIGILLVVVPEQNAWSWPQQWLAGTPFHDFRIPGLLFVLLIGTTNFWGFMNLIKENPRQYDRVMLGGYSLVLWVMIELLLSRELYLIHLTALFLGGLLILMAYQEKEKWAV